MACLVRRHSSPALVVPHDVAVVVVAVRAQRLPEHGVAGAMAGEAGQGPAVRAGLGVAAGVAGLRWQVQRALSVQVCSRTGRVWTGPKEGAVKVANTAG